MLLHTSLKYLSFFSFSAASAVLRCWRCSTDVSNGEFCNDPFQPDSISEQQRYWSYVNCTYSVGVKSVNARPVCKKLVQEGEYCVRVEGGKRGWVLLLWLQRPTGGCSHHQAGRLLLLLLLRRVVACHKASNKIEIYCPDKVSNKCGILIHRGGGTRGVEQRNEHARFQLQLLGGGRALTSRRGMCNCTSGDTWPKPGQARPGHCECECELHVPLIYGKFMCLAYTNKREGDRQSERESEREKTPTHAAYEWYSCRTRRSASLSLLFLPAARANCAACWHLHLTSNNKREKKEKLNKK